MYVIKLSDISNKLEVEKKINSHLLAEELKILCNNKAVAISNCKTCSTKFPNTKKSVIVQ